MSMPSSSPPVEIEPSPPQRVALWKMGVAFLILIVFLSLIAWGLRRANQGAIRIGDPVPAFTFTTFDGQTINTADYAGKVVVINFWASWCKPCEQEARELEQAYQHYQEPGDVIFLGLAYVDTEPNALEYLQKFSVTYPNGPDLATKISQMFRVTGVPETFIINREGKLAYFKGGPFLSLNEIITLIDTIRQK